MLKHTMHRFEEFCFFLLSLLPGDAYYIGGPENLPPPLDHEQEKLVFEQLETGNPHARELLITHNLRLVVYIAKKFENSGVSVEDIISIGTIGLIKAVNTFKPSKKIKLATYASRCIENELRMELRRTRRTGQTASLQEPLEGDSGMLTLADVLPDEAVMEDGCEQRDAIRRLRALVDRLPDREREIVLMRFGLEGRKELTQKEVARKMGISQSYISRLEKRIMLRLKKEFLRQTSCA